MAKGRAPDSQAHCLPVPHTPVCGRSRAEHETGHNKERVELAQHWM